MLIWREIDMFHCLQLALYRDNMQSMLEKVENIPKELKEKDILLEKAKVQVMEAEELVKQSSWATMETAIPTQPYLWEQSTQSSRASMEMAIPTQPYLQEQSTQSSWASMEMATSTQPYSQEQSSAILQDVSPRNPSCFHSVIQSGMRMRTCIWVIMKQVN